MTKHPLNVSRLMGRLRYCAWTPIATATQGPGGVRQWDRIEQSPLTVPQARRLYDDGHLEIAHRREGDGALTLVVLKRQVQETARFPWFGSVAGDRGSRKVAT